MSSGFNTILPGSRWKAFLRRAALYGSRSNLDGGAFAAVAKRWSGRAISRRGLVCSSSSSPLQRP